MNIININSDYTEGIGVLRAPNNADVGLRSMSSFHCSVTAMSNNYEDVDLLLHAYNSKSLPYHKSTQNAWAKLKPQWRFVDKNENPIDGKIKIEYHTELKRDGDVVGAIGDIEFYYIDDISTEYGKPVLLIATLDGDTYNDISIGNANDIFIPAHYNSRMTTIFPFYVLPLKPRLLRFTQNGKVELNNIQWAGVDIPSYATIHGFTGYDRMIYKDNPEDIRNTPILYEYPIDQATRLDYNLMPVDKDPVLREKYPEKYPIERSIEFKQHELSGKNVYGGWVKTDEIISDVRCDTAILYGTVNLLYNAEDIEYRRISQLNSVWIYNLDHKIHNINFMFIDLDSDELSPLTNIMSNKTYSPAYNKAFELSAEDNTYYDTSSNMPTSDFKGYDRYSTCHDLINNNVFFAHFELDKIYKYNEPNGELDLLCEFSMDWLGPTSISMDRFNRLFGSFYNSPSCFRYDTSLDDINITYFKPSTITSEFKGVKVQVDNKNGLHIAYSNAGSNKLVYYPFESISGNEIIDYYKEKEIDTNQSNYEIFDFIIQRNPLVKRDHIYISMYDNSTNNGGIYRVDFDLESKEYITELPHEVCSCHRPQYIAIDKNDVLWFSHGIYNNKIGKYCIDDEILELDYYVLEGGNSDTIGGLCVDRSNSVNIIDSIRKKIIKWGINAQSSDLISGGIFEHQVYTKTDLNILKEGESLAPNRLNAFGDWSGFIFDYTFNTAEETESESIELSGYSYPFEIKSFSEKYGFRKYNDSWNMHEQIKSYILPDYQKDFIVLWEDLVGNFIGNGSDGFKSMGTQIYEKIANFLQNHLDISTSNIEQLHSLFNSISVKQEEYNLLYPPELKHWINILSIYFERLRGSEYKCLENFVDKNREEIDPCENCGNIHKSYLGNKLPLDYQMDIGHPIVIKNIFKRQNKFHILYPSIDGPLEKLELFGYNPPFHDNYEVYEYIIPENDENKQAYGIINWEDQFNDIDIKKVKFIDWFDDGGIVEQIYAQVLYKNIEGELLYATEESAALSFGMNKIEEFKADDIRGDIGRMRLEIIPPMTFYSNPFTYEYAIPIYKPFDPSSSGDFSQRIEIEPRNSESIGPSLSYLNFSLIIDGLERQFYIPLYVSKDVIIVIDPIFGNNSLLFNELFYSIEEPQYRLKFSGYVGLNYMDEDESRYIPIYEKWD